MIEPKLFPNVEERAIDLEIDCGCLWRIPWDTETIIARPCRIERHRERLVECLEQVAEEWGVELEIVEEDGTQQEARV